MLIFQITLFVTFLFLILGYSYMLLTPALLIGCTPIVNYAKQIINSFITTLITKGFKANLKLAETKQDIKKLINENTDKVDIIVCNHISTFDLIIAGYLKEFEIDSCNVIFKNEIVYTPGFGYILYANTDIKLKRNWEQDKEALGKQLDNIKPNGKKQVIIIFPEGTRLTEQKLKEGQEFSKLNNLPVYENLMVPKSKGLWFIVNKLSETNKLGRIWDVTFVFPKFLKKSISYSDVFGKSMGDVNAIWREVVLEKDYKDSDAFKKWLINLWVTKDSLIKYHEKIIFNEIYPESKIKTSEKLIAIITLLVFVGLLFNKYGRYYLLGSFILSYILILFKL
jgi:1-acyl-sn-glycerol-3-phosphate acyltransferase